jgi:hypothetical protein
VVPLHLVIFECFFRQSCGRMFVVAVCTATCSRPNADPRCHHYYRCCHCLMCRHHRNPRRRCRLGVPSRVETTARSCVRRRRTTSTKLARRQPAPTPLAGHSTAGVAPLQPHVEGPVAAVDDQVCRRIVAGSHPLRCVLAGPRWAPRAAARLSQSKSPPEPGRVRHRSVAPQHTAAQHNTAGA